MRGRCFPASSGAFEELPDEFEFANAESDHDADEGDHCGFKE